MIKRHKCQTKVFFLSEASIKVDHGIKNLKHGQSGKTSMRHEKAEVIVFYLLNQCPDLIVSAFSFLLELLNFRP